MYKQLKRPDRRSSKTSEGLHKLVSGYRALKKRISDALGRGEQDNSALTSLSQEIAAMRGRIKDELETRRNARAASRAQGKQTFVRADSGRVAP